MEASVTKVARVSARFSKSLARRRFRPNQENVRSTSPSRRDNRVCPECGSWISGPPRDGVVRVRAGTLDDTRWLRPTRHIWTRSKQPWITFAEGDQIFEAQPPA
jgi:hypothetical protein